MATTNTLAAYEKQKQSRLLVGIIFDILGMATFFFPGVAEVGDLAWAPIAAATFFSMYRGMTGILGGSVVFIEEILPITDVMPTFTVAWLWVYVINGEKNKARFLKSKANTVEDGTIDITHLQNKKLTT